MPPGLHNYEFGFSLRCAEEEKKFMEKGSNFGNFRPAPTAPVWQSHEIYNLYLLTPNWVHLLTHDG